MSQSPPARRAGTDIVVLGSGWPAETRRLRVRPGHFVERAGQRWAVAVLGGWVEWTRPGAVDRPEGVVPPGMVAGLALHRSSRIQDLWAISEAEVAIWEAEELRRAVHGSHRRALELLRAQAGWCCWEAEIEACRAGPAARRLARFLLPTTPIPWSPTEALGTLRRRDLARVLALSPESLSRALRHLQEQAILDPSRTDPILDRGALLGIRDRGGRRPSTR